MISSTQTYGIPSQDYFVTVLPTFGSKAKGHGAKLYAKVHYLIREGNDKADHQAVLTNSIWRVFLDRIWTRYIQFRRHWKRRVALLTPYQLAKAIAEVPDTSISENDQVREEVSHFDFEKFPNSAKVSAQLGALSEGNMPFTSSHDAAFRQHAVQIFWWIISEDQPTSFMRPVSLLEIYVCYRCSLVGKRPLLELGNCVTLFSVVSFANDFSHLKKV